MNIKKSMAKQRTLTTREREVLILIAFEHTNDEIAKKLKLSKGTVATYRNKLLTKLDVKNTAGLIRIAFEESILILDKMQRTILKTYY